jgi:hypothetical protein
MTSQVRVKPLEWRNGYRDWQVKIQQASTGPLYQVRELDGVVWLDADNVQTVYPSVEAAKAAAQADYEARILSALSPQADDNAEEPVAWQPKYKQEVIDHHKSIGSGLWDYAMTVYPTKEKAENYGGGGHEVRPLYAHQCTSTSVVSQNAPGLEDKGGDEKP